MNMPDAFLDDIRANPDENGPRLIFADWLEDNGQPERAEFIRAEIELTRPGVPAERRRILRGRVDELRGAHGKEWLGLLAELSTGGFGLAFRSWYCERGLPVVCLHPRTVLGKAFQAHGAGWLREAGVVEVRLSGGTQHLKALASPALAGVTVVSFVNGTLTAADVPLLAGGPLTGLLSLGFELSDCREVGVRALLASPRFPSLARLRVLSNDTAWRGALGALFASDLWTRLRAFDAEHLRTEVKDVEALAEALPRSRIDSLTLAGQSVGDRKVAILAASPTIRQLTSLDVHESQIGPRGVAALAGSPHLTGLRALSLIGNAIEEEGARALAESPHLGGLQRLNVTKCYLDAPALSVLERRFGDALLAGPQSTGE